MWSTASAASPSSVPSALPASLDLLGIRAALQRSSEGEEGGGGGGGGQPPSPFPAFPASSRASASFDCPPSAVCVAGSLLPLPCLSPVVSGRRDKSTLVLSLTKRLRSMKQLLQAQQGGQRATAPSPLQGEAHTPSADRASAATTQHTQPQPQTQSRTATADDRQGREEEEEEEEEGGDDDGEEADKENAQRFSSSSSASGAPSAQHPALLPLHPTAAAALPSALHQVDGGEKQKDLEPVKQLKARKQRVGVQGGAPASPVSVCAAPPCSGCARLEQSVARLTAELASASTSLAAERERVATEVERLQRRYAAVIQEKEEEVEDMRQLIEQQLRHAQPQTQPIQRREAAVAVEVEEVGGAVAAESFPSLSSAVSPTSSALPICASPSAVVPAYPTLTPSSSPLLSPAQLAPRLNDTEELITYHAAQQPPTAAHRTPHSGLPSTPSAFARRSPPPSHPLPLPPRSPYPSQSPHRAPSACRRALLSPPTPPAAAAVGLPCSSTSPIGVAWQSYLERKGLQRERELQAIPITSPSTPDSKRRKIRDPTPTLPTHRTTPQQPLQSSTAKQPLPLIHAVAAHSSASASPSPKAPDLRRPIAPAQLHFDDDGDAAASGSSATNGEVSTPCTAAPPLYPAPAAAVSALHRRAETAGGRLELRCAAVADGEAQLRRASSGRVEADGAAVGVSAALAPVSVADGRRLSSELRRLRLQLDVKVEWTLRVKALNGVEELSREEAGIIGRWGEWGRELELLRGVMAEQLTDLRSSIVREACRTLIALCEANRTAFDREVDTYLPLLYRGLYVTIRVIRDSCTECMQAIVQRMRSSRTLSALMQGCADPHCIVRERCGSCIQHCIAPATALTVDAGGALSGCSAPAASPAEVEAAAAELSCVIASRLQDSDHNTRAAFRQLYRAFTHSHPHHATSSASHPMHPSLHSTLPHWPLQQLTLTSLLCCVRALRWCVRSYVGCTRPSLVWCSGRWTVSGGEAAAVACTAAAPAGGAAPLEGPRRSRVAATRSSEAQLSTTAHPPPHTSTLPHLTSHARWTLQVRYPATAGVEGDDTAPAVPLPPSPTSQAEPWSREGSTERLRSRAAEHSKGEEAAERRRRPQPPPTIVLYNLHCTALYGLAPPMLHARRCRCPSSVSSPSSPQLPARA